MGVREQLNKYSAISTGAIILLLIVVVNVIVWQARGGGARALTKVFYTDDDGKTWFRDSLDRTPPFDHDGKQAVRCYVYECKKSGKQYVAYMEKFTDQIKAKLEAAQSTHAIVDLSQGRLYKKPGAASWVTEGNGEALRDATTVQCPDDPNADVELVSP